MKKFYTDDVGIEHEIEKRRLKEKYERKLKGQKEEQRQSKLRKEEKRNKRLQEVWN